MKHALDMLEDFCRAYFDKLLLCGLFGVLVWIGSVSANDEVKQWAMGQANTVIGAIIMLTTGKLVERYRNGNGNGQPPNQSEGVK